MPHNHRRTFGITGFPLGHSLSPALHTWVYGQIGLAADYRTFETPPDKLAEFMAKVRKEPIHGLSVTIPHKQTVMEHLDGLSELAKVVGAVNTLYWNDKLLMGTNTDVAGFLSPLEKRKFMPEAALVLGSGGAARAVLAGIRTLNPDSDIFIASRGMQKAVALADDFMGIPISWEKRTEVQVNLVVNTTPLGMTGTLGETETPLGKAGFEKILPSDGSGLVYDLVYRPLLTPFLLAAQSCSCQTQDGLDMLLAQGLAQIKLWTDPQYHEKLPSAAEARERILRNNLL